MELIREHALPVPVDEAWAALNDVAMLQACIPGCEALTRSGDQEFELLIVVSVGPLKARFRGLLRLADLRPPSSYTIQVESQGATASHGRGLAYVRLEPNGAEGTLLRYTANASFGGRMARVGSRLTELAVRKLANDFFSAFVDRLRDRTVR